MPKGPFTAEEFIATQWNTAENKAVFGNHLLRFIEAGFPQNLFTKSLYDRLSMCFQHIAHCDIHGFYAEWFTTPGDQARFLTQALLRRPGLHLLRRRKKSSGRDSTSQLCRDLSSASGRGATVCGVGPSRTARIQVPSANLRWIRPSRDRVRKFRAPTRNA